MIDPDSGRPVYRQLADVIRGQIDRGELRPGQRLRTEPEYVDEYEIGRDSVRKAMALLRAEGLIVTTRQGSRVRPQPDMAEVSLSEDTQVRTRMPTQKERRVLGVAEGVPVFVVERPGAEPEVLAGDRTTLVVRGGGGREL
ncbi:GntR family transcriptional regulator [Nonomuraea wenchangensis]|uniref:Regulatory protein, gntR family n=1 Tax=Nonomuraea wenchangensis TaxID=568860 RepID=A0A1I0EPD4_9ACTN|nr:GntR family transcriptional regulator [Nonomuraea wenchangensis]SET46879.1 regulatory protein, gntR family [Nonomuraea wenchangensis]